MQSANYEALNTNCLPYIIDFIYHYTFFEITKFSKILLKLTFFSQNFESMFEINVNFESIFENFVISKKGSMVDEVTIRLE